MATDKKTKTKKNIKKAGQKKADDKPRVPLYNQKGEVVKNISLPEKIFGQRPNPPLLSQVIRVYLSKKKPHLAVTKTRSQVSGSGRKPWRQKGTGRARVGSIRAPGRRGGGVVFGPVRKEGGLSLTKKMRKKALAIALSGKVVERVIVLVDKLNFKEPKSKKAAQLLGKITPGAKKTIRLVLEDMDEATVKSFRNLKEVEISRALDLSTLDVLKSSRLIFTLEALEKLKERFGETDVKNN
ncbi:MAG TPA: 50S ribosomal protein L4 [Candidatus Nanoarchaeia archaeon]